MKRIIVVCIALGLVFSLSACTGSGPKSEPGMTGYVMNRDGERILVIDSEPQDFSSTGGVDEFYNAIWFSQVPEEIQAGDKVNVWFDMVADSYPGQSEAEHIEVIAGDQPEGATLDESEALFRAFTSPEYSGDSVVREVSYVPQTGIWIIELKELWDEVVYTIEVVDE